MPFKPRLFLSFLPTVLRRKMHVGDLIVGRKAHYRLTQVLQVVNNVPTVLKADVIPNGSDSNIPHCAIVKAAAPGDEASRDALVREYNMYQVRSIAKSRYIRTMFDLVGDPSHLDEKGRAGYPGLILEWLDTTLQDVPPKQYRHNLAFIHTIVLAVLSSSETFRAGNYVNTGTSFLNDAILMIVLLILDLKPDNILISGINSSNPIVKVGDLGSVHDIGSAFECQPFAMRAPEVWRGFPCRHQSEIWALASLLLVWMNPRILGTSGINGYITGPIWSIAKLMQLFPAWRAPLGDKEFLRDEFEIAEMLSNELDLEQTDKKRIDVGSLNEEMQAMRLTSTLQDLLRALMVTDCELRPSASEVLASRQYLALREAASDLSKT